MLNTAQTTLQERDTQLETLTKSTGDVEALKAQIGDTGLRRQRDREQVYGFGRSQSSRAVWANRRLQSDGGSGILKVRGGDSLNMLPRADKAIIPIRKLVDYALSPSADPDKARAFELALGYNRANADKLIQNIRTGLSEFEAKRKGNQGYGETYEVIMRITGENGKTAKVLTAWIDDAETGEMRLITLHVD